MKALLKLIETREDLFRLVLNCEKRGISVVHKKFGLRLNDHFQAPIMRPHPPIRPPPSRPDSASTTAATEAPSASAMD